MLVMRGKKGGSETPRGAWGRPDPWQTAVYAFEDDWQSFGKASLTLQQCRELVGAACQAYNLKRPPVHQHEGKMMSFLLVDDKNPKAWKISFRLDHKNPAIVLHEAAHYVVDRLLGPRAVTQDHGPTWQGVYFFLLARSGIAPLEALQASARRHGLRWREIAPGDICK